jgi:hypothetical protein
MSTSVHRLNLPRCEFPQCNKIGEIKLIRDGVTFFLCSNHFEKYSEENEILKPINFPEIKLEVRGLFKTSSVVQAHSDFSSNHWKDFGRKKKIGKGLISKIYLKAIILTFVEDNNLDKEEILYGTGKRKMPMIKISLSGLYDGYAYFDKWQKDLLFVEINNKITYF